MFVRIADLRVRAWFEVVKILAVDVLWSPSSIGRSISGIFQSELKVVPWPTCPVLILSSSPNVSLLFLVVSVSNVQAAHPAKSSEGNNEEEKKNFTYAKYLVKL